MFVVFVITCIVFVVLLIVTGFLLFYVNRLARGHRAQSETHLAIGEDGPVAGTERRIAS